MNYPDWESMKTAWDKEGTVRFQSKEHFEYETSQWPPNGYLIRILERGELTALLKQLKEYLEDE